MSRHTQDKHSTMMPIRVVLLGLLAATATTLVSGTSPVLDGLPASWGEFESRINSADNLMTSGEHLERVKRGLPRLRELFRPKSQARQGNGINVAFSFPFDSLGEILINLAPVSHSNLK